MLKWLQTMILLLAAVPAFTGLGLMLGPAVLDGLHVSRLFYWLIISLAILLTRGRFLWLTANVIALAICIPVVVGGGLLALLLYTLNQSAWGLAQIAAHYAILLVSMLSMIPLGISLVSLIPTAAIETRLLNNVQGITPGRKILLMAVRVFNHVVFTVMPEILQTVREELRFNGYLYRTRTRRGKRRLFVKSALQKLMFVAITALCVSLKYIYFWAGEISALPDKKRK